MLKVTCPWCGERSQEEFSFHGEAHIPRPLTPDELDDPSWGDYVFVRENPKGWVRERIVHDAGCRRWFNAVRHTVSDSIVATYRMDEAKPPFPGESE